jgi:tRNA A37 threonylcarbamoyladenosine synthetase subunit TsaC/SUA5/YrdC
LGLRLIDGPLTGMMWPVFQTSANRSGEPAPAIFADVPRGILSAVDVAIDGGALTGSPSTVVDVTALDSGGEWTVLRQGGMPAEELRERFNPV